MIMRIINFHFGSGGLRFLEWSSLPAISKITLSSFWRDRILFPPLERRERAVVENENRKSYSFWHWHTYSVLAAPPAFALGVIFQHCKKLGVCVCVCVCVHVNTVNTVVPKEKKTKQNQETSVIKGCITSILFKLNWGGSAKLLCGCELWVENICLLFNFVKMGKKKKAKFTNHGLE